MGAETKQECLERTRRRYRRAGRKYKKIILDEFCATWGYNRKYAIDLFNGKTPKKKGRRGRPARYGKREHRALERIWLAANRPCSRRLKAILPTWVPFYEQQYDRLDPSTRKNLLRISKNSIDRLLKPTRRKYGSRGRSGTRPGTQLLHQIPIKTSHWDVSEPGFMQADTVAHGGDSMEGDFAHSLTLTDICSGWTETGDDVDKHFWYVELTWPDIYCHRQLCCGSVIMDPTLGKPVFVHIPGLCVVWEEDQVSTILAQSEDAPWPHFGEPRP